MTLGRQKADVFAAIADPTRRSVLLRLASEGEKTVTALLEPFAMSQPAVSKHLRVLRDAGLVHTRKRGRERLYDVNATRLRQVHEWVSHFERYWDDKLGALGDYLDRKKRGGRTAR